MTHFYLDADAQFKRYVAETGSNWIRRLFAATDEDNEPRHDFYTIDISQIEVSAAIAAAQRTKRIDAETQVELFERHINEVAGAYVAIPADAALQMEACHLTQQHALKALDALHLAAALRLDRALAEFELSLTLLSSDRQFLAAAQAEGLPAENPVDYREVDE